MVMSIVAASLLLTCADNNSTSVGISSGYDASQSSNASGTSSSSSSVDAKNCSYNAASNTLVCVDGNTYKTTVIGAQTWMAENLNYKIAADKGSRCYGNDRSECTTYGRLYDYKTALTACPNGWHLPDTTEWNTLESTIGTVLSAVKLKANSDLWKLNQGTDEFGFSALPGGQYQSTTFYSIGDAGYWWSATPDGVDLAHYWFMFSDVGYIYKGCNDIVIGMSVRCLKD